MGSEMCIRDSLGVGCSLLLAGTTFLVSAIALVRAFGSLIH